jgi:actin-related protein
MLEMKNSMTQIKTPVESINNRLDQEEKKNTIDWNQMEEILHLKAIKKNNNKNQTKHDHKFQLLQDMFNRQKSKDPWHRIRC